MRVGVLAMIDFVQSYSYEVFRAHESLFINMTFCIHPSHSHHFFLFLFLSSSSLPLFLSFSLSLSFTHTHSFASTSPIATISLLLSFSLSLSFTHNQLIDNRKIKTNAKKKHRRTGIVQGTLDKAVTKFKKDQGNVLRGVLFNCLWEKRSGDGDGDGDGDDSGSGSGSGSDGDGDAVDGGSGGEHGDGDGDGSDSGSDGDEWRRIKKKVSMKRIIDLFTTATGFLTALADTDAIEVYVNNVVLDLGYSFETVSRFVPVCA